MSRAAEPFATFHGSNYLPLGPVFGAHRAALFRVRRALDLHSTSQDQTLVRAVAYILMNDKRRVKYLPPAISLDVANEQWQRLVQTKQNGKVVYHRAWLEMCVFTCVANEFKSGDWHAPVRWNMPISGNACCPGISVRQRSLGMVSNSPRLQMGEHLWRPCVEN